ncbi:MAG TPA: LysM domain-containing protein, partial [Chthonomonadaceae bacterium]|nr:LysM domain-containing protein [Chthonomonadaceae bacterium]
MAFVVDKADYRGRTAAVLGRLLPHLSQAVIGALLLASACAAGAQNANAAQNEAAAAPRYHIVKPGETLTLLARQYEVSLQDIVSANRLTDANRLGAGQPLLIPRARQAVGSQRTPQRPEQRRPARTQRSISLTFAGVDISDVLDQIARYARTDILLTPGAKGTVTLSLQNRTPDEAIRLAAAAAGLTAVNAGGVYMVGPAAEVKQAVAEYGQTEVVPLRYMTPAEAADVLTRAVPTVRAEASKNAVVITGLPADLAAARAALNNLDVQAATPRETTRQTNVVTLRYADPENAERVLTEAIPDLKVTRQDRTLILNGTAADLETATRAIQSLDTEAPKPIETQQVLVYHLRYLNAQRAEDALKKALPDLTITVGPEPIAPPTANFTPLSSGLLGGGGGSGGGGGF